MSEQSVAPASRPLLAAGMILLGMAAVTFVDQFIAVLKSEASVWQFLAIRGVIMLAVLVLFARFRGETLRVISPGGVALRSISMSLGLVVYFGALGFVSVSTAAAGLFTSPIFVLLISAFFLRQHVGPWRIGAVLLGFVGVLVVLNPEAVGQMFNGGGMTLFGGGKTSLTVYLPALGGLFYGAAVVATRQWCGQETTLVLTAYYVGALGLIAGLAMIWLTFFPAVDQFGFYLGSGFVVPTGTFWAVTLLQAVGSMAGIVFLTIGYQTGEASYVAAFEYSALVFSALFTWMIFATLPAGWAIVGMGLIILAGVILAWRAR